MTIPAVYAASNKSGIKDVGEASESLISTIKGFGLEASEAMRIVDRFNNVGKNVAQAA